MSSEYEYLPPPASLSRSRQSLRGKREEPEDSTEKDPGELPDQPALEQDGAPNVEQPFEEGAEPHAEQVLEPLPEGISEEMSDPDSDEFPDDALIAPDDPIVRRSLEPGVAVSLSGEEHSEVADMVSRWNRSTGNTEVLALELEGVARKLREGGVESLLDGTESSRFALVLRGFIVGYLTRDESM
jgi:hypothetical protein